MDLADSYGNPGSTEAEVATIRAIYDAFARRDVEGALAFVDEECEFHPHGTTTLTGRVDPYRGHDGVREYFADAARVWQELTLHADDLRAAGGGVVVFGHVEACSEGVPVRRQVVWIWQVRDGRATSMRISDLGETAPD